MTDSLVTFARQRAGEYLRAVAEYERTEFHLLYYRDDLDRATIAERVDTIHDNITWSWNPDDDEGVAALGEKRATLQIREQAVILHLLEGRHRGYLVGLDPAAARDLTSFVGECLAHVE